MKGAMFEDDLPAEIADGTIGRSNKSSLSNAFPQAIHHNASPISFKDTETSPANTVDPTRTGYREGYVNNVMSGVKQIAESDFNDVDLDYGTSGGLPPGHEGIPPSQEVSTAALGDNTIASDAGINPGYGPNVATLDPADLGSAPMVDGSYESTPPFEGNGKATPLAKSASISSRGIFGGSTLSGAGTKGKSGA